eukprot:6669681-Pyramimonas_sp.AAC.1
MEYDELAPLVPSSWRPELRSSSRMSCPRISKRSVSGALRGEQAHSSSLGASAPAGTRMEVPSASRGAALGGGAVDGVATDDAAADDAAAEAAGGAAAAEADGPPWNFAEASADAFARGQSVSARRPTGFGRGENPTGVGCGRP